MEKENKDQELDILCGCRRVAEDITGTKIDTVKLILVNKDLKVLFVRSHKYWTLPGGRLEDHEDCLTKALDRELYEELTINLTDIAPIRRSLIFVHKGYVNYVTVTSTLPGIDFKLKASNEILEYRWVDIDLTKEPTEPLRGY